MKGIESFFTNSKKIYKLNLWFEKYVKLFIEPWSIFKSSGQV